ncbi:MAG: 4-demethylwyosine synthase TYW1 [Candidatus Altiarchaeota archaeon]|nr:4-demethylwyosine synthase TYW1 [Candidatus Altiarchaeota archaeon]
MELLSERAKKILKKQHYRLVGRHSAVKLCHWTKKSLLDEGYCYKQKFYGIQTHRCLQMTPSVLWCTQKCVFCWRKIEETIGAEIKKGGLDEPGEIIDGAIEAQRVLLAGYGGIPDRVNQRKLREARNPNQTAISLSGEPTVYPMISGLVEEFNKRDFTTFLVTNGTLPERIREMNSLPTQLYVSLEAPNKELHKKVCNPIIADAWDKINETLTLLPSLDTRKVVRLTAIKGLNMIEPKEYARIIAGAEPDYVEVKAFMLVGGSRNRLTLDHMPSHEEVKGFASLLAEELSYKIKDEKKNSRVVLLSRK